MPVVKDKPVLPLFELYTVEELSKLTPYREPYLFRIKLRWTPVTPKFRETVCKCLRRSEAELFGDEFASSQA